MTTDIPNSPGSSPGVRPCSGSQVRMRAVAPRDSVLSRYSSRVERQVDLWGFDCLGGTKTVLSFESCRDMSIQMLSNQDG